MRLDSSDFAELYDRHGRELLGFFARRTDPGVAVELLGETFARAFAAREQFRGESLEAARAWLYGVAHNRLRDYLRHGRVERRALARLGVQTRALTDEEHERIEELAASHELRETVSEEFAALADGQREVLRLRVVEGRPYAEVALALGVSEETARARGSRALRALRESRRLRDLKEATDGS